MRREADNSLGRPVALLLALCAALLLVAASVAAQEPVPPSEQPQQPDDAKPRPELVPDETPPTNLTQPRPEVTTDVVPGATKIGRIERGELATVLYRVAGDKVRVIKAFADPLLTKDKGSIVVGDEKLPLVSITDTKENLLCIEKMIEMIDSPSPQVLIQAVISEESKDRSHQYGIEVIDERIAGTFFSGLDMQFNPSDYMALVTAGTPDRFQGATFSFFHDELDRSDITGTIRMLQSRTDAKILSQPRVRVIQNRMAKVTSGQEVIFYEGVVVNATVHVTGKPREVGVTLQVTPNVVGGEYICLDIKSEVSAIIGYQPVGGADIGLQNPIIAKRTAETELVVKDGELIELGGLIRTEQVLSETGLPFLKDIPVLGYLFGQEEARERETEIIFYLQAHIIRPGGVYPARVIQPDGGN